MLKNEDMFSKYFISSLDSRSFKIIIKTVYLDIFFQYLPLRLIAR
jgi:hypothetical protein